MKQASPKKRISFLCEPELYRYIQAAGKALYRPQSLQINYLLALALELEEEDWDVNMFRNWLRDHKEKEVSRKEEWLKKELSAIEGNIHPKKGA